MFDLQDYTLRLGSDTAVEAFPTVIRIDSKDGESGWRIKLTPDGLEITKNGLGSDGAMNITPLVSNQIVIK